MFWITGVLGIAFIAAPFVLGYSTNTNALWSSIILGVVILLVSLYKAIAQDKGKWEYWVDGLAGLVAIAIPFALGFSTLATAMWACVVLGALVVISSGYEVFFAEPETP